jgi:hypothetical protein
MLALRKIAAGVTITGVLGAAAVGIGSGVASATPASPGGAGTVWAQDHDGWGHGNDDWYGHDNGWHGDHRGWDNGPGIYWPRPCITGPFGYVTVCAP